MGQLVQIATVLSFVTAPLYAYLNFRLILSKQMPKKYQPRQGLKIPKCHQFIVFIKFYDNLSFKYLIIRLSL